MKSRKMSNKKLTTIPLINLLIMFSFSPTKKTERTHPLSTSYKRKKNCKSKWTENYYISEQKKYISILDDKLFYHLQIVGKRSSKVKSGKYIRFDF